MTAVNNSKVMEETKVNTGPWKILKVLGSGAFGQVTVWHNNATGQRVAIKTLNESNLKDHSNKSQQVRRWCQEVLLFQNLSHTNIVSLMTVPVELRKITVLPMLAMEYCSKGDLRQMLNQPENSCGLREPDVIDILKDIAKGLIYLHNANVTHRNLKPENIVLQEYNTGVVYKLIDLGYSKTFEQDYSKSSVGRIQYIAPELFFRNEYSFSADYWSFGLVAHEVITGFRPFLPGMNPSECMKRIQNKPRDIICVVENENGDVTFSSTISRINHLSRCLLEDIEKWLQLALDWDDRTRGRHPGKNTVAIFDELHNILRKEVINVFSLPTYETLSYEVDFLTGVDDLRRWIKKDTELVEEDQLLLLPDGKALDRNGGLLQALNTKLDRKGISIFLYNSGPIELMRYNEVKPDFVDPLLRANSEEKNFGFLKRKGAHTIYFLQFEALRYSNLLRGIRTKIDNTKQKTLAIESLLEYIGDEWNQVENYAQFLSLSHKVDLENYIYYRRIGKLESSAFVRKWIENVTELERSITSMKVAFQKNEQRELLLLARQRCRMLNTQTENETYQKNPLDKIVKEGYELWAMIMDNDQLMREVQNVSESNSEFRITNASANHLLKKCIEETSKLLESQVFGSLFVKISEADENLVKFLAHAKIFSKSTKTLKLLIENTQKERQKEVWNLIETAKVGERENLNGNVDEERDDTSEGSVEYIKDPKKHFWDQSPPNPDMNVSMTESMSSRQTDLEGMSLDDFSDVDSIISDNTELRYRIQDAEQDCHKLIKEIRSFNWEFIEDK